MKQSLKKPMSLLFTIIPLKIPCPLFRGPISSIIWNTDVYEFVCFFLTLDLIPEILSSFNALLRARIML